MGVCEARVRTTVLMLALALLFIPAALAGDKYGVVNIAAAYNSRATYEGPKHIFYQTPDGDLFVRSYVSGWKDPQKVSTASPPKKNSPLAAFYYTDDYFTDKLSLFYVDRTDHIIRTEGEFTGVDIIVYSSSSASNWGSTRQGSDGDTTSSGIAVVELTTTAHLYYLDSESYVVEMIDGKNPVRLGPKARPGSNVAVANPAGAQNIYVFFISPDMSLSQIEYDGRSWLPVKTVVDKFTSDPQIGFAAVAWSEPLVIRIFYINKDRYPSELVYQDASWHENPDGELSHVQANKAGDHVGAGGHGSNSSEAFAQYFYTVQRTITNLLKYSPGANWVAGDFAGITISSPPKPRYSTSDKIALGCGLGIGIPTLIITLLSWKSQTFKLWLKALFDKIRGKKSKNESLLRAKEYAAVGQAELFDETSTTHSSMYYSHHV